MGVIRTLVIRYEDAEKVSGLILSTDFESQDVFGDAMVYAEEAAICDDVMIDLDGSREAQVILDAVLNSGVQHVIG